MADNIKLIVALTITIGAIILFYAYSEYSTLLRVISLLTLAAISLFIASRTQAGLTILDYVYDTQTEVRKVVWATRQETVQTTLIVILMVTLMALLLWGVDSILGWLVRTLTL